MPSARESPDAATALLLLAQSAVVRRLEREVERALVVARVVAGTRGRGQRERVRREEVAPPHLGRVVPELGREEVHRPLDRLRGLGSAGAAERARRGRVGDDAHRVGLDLRDGVDTARHQRREAREDGADPRVRPRLLHHPQAVGLDVPVAAAADRELEMRCPAVGHRDHVLAPRLGPADGTSRLAREPGHEDLLDTEKLRPEAPTDVGRDDAHLGGLESEDRREVPSVLVRRLRREPERQPPVVAHDGGAHPRLERARGHPLAHEAAGDHDVAAVEQGFVPFHRVARAHVRTRLGMEQHVALERRAGIDHDGERVVVHCDELGGVDTCTPRLADDDRDDVADEADDTVCEVRSAHPLVEARHRRRLEPAEVGVGGREDLHPRQRRYRRRVDLAESRMRVRRADESRVERIGELEVLDVLAHTAQEPVVLPSEDPLPHHAAHARTLSHRGTASEGTV